MPRSLTEQQIADLRALMSRLSFPIAAKLLTALERDRLAGGGELPHELLIDFIRPKIIEEGGVTPRFQSPQRLFCQPFEDLLYVGRLPEKEFGRISRESLNPLWEWLHAELLADEMPDLTQKLSAAILNEKDTEVFAAIGAIQRLASQRIKEALEEASASRSATRALGERLGTDGVVDDIREIAEILEFGPEIMKVQLRYPRPVDHMTDEDLFDFRKHYNVFDEHMSNAIPHLMLIMMGRFARPWEMLGVVASFTQASDDSALSSSADVGIIGDSLLRDAERFARDLEMDNADVPNSLSTILKLELFTDLVQGVTKELGIRKEGEWGQRILNCRKKVSDAMERRLEKAVMAIQKALPMKSGAATGIVNQRPDISEMPDADLMDVAVDAGMLITGVKKQAAKSAFVAAQMSAADKAGKITQAYASDLVDEIRASESDARHVAQTLMNHVLEVAETLMDPGDVDLLRRRAAAASRAA